MNKAERIIVAILTTIMLIWSVKIGLDLQKEGYDRGIKEGLRAQKVSDTLDVFQCMRDQDLPPCLVEKFGGG